MTEPILTRGKILIIDDEIANIRLLEMMLEDAGYRPFVPAAPK